MTVSTEIMKVKMLGQFEISYKGIILNADTIRSNMLELLLVYLLTQRHRDVLTNDLADALWSEEESDNPLGALKNLMYRLRKTLKERFKDDDIIVTGRGTYTLNPNIQVEVDAEQFDEQVKESIRKQSKKSMIHALSLYGGAYLPKQIKYHWILQQNVYYQSLYGTAIKGLITMLEKSEEYEQMEVWSIKALQQDALDESVHYYFLLSLIKQDKMQAAKDHYLYLKDRLYDELGVAPNEDLQELYQTLVRKDNDRQLDLVVIQQELKEEELPNKAYFCDYTVFKEMYRLDARRLKRLGISIYCCLVTCDVTLPIPPTSALYAATVQKMMTTLKDVLQSSLRAGDIVSRYSKSQFVALLPTCSQESMQVVIERIQEEFIQCGVSRQGVLLFDFKEIVLES